jgi:hypothetical protein
LRAGRGLIVGTPTAADVGDRDVRTLVGKEVSDRATEATRSARHERGLAIQLAQIMRESTCRAALSASPEIELLTYLLRPEDAHVHRLQDAHGALHELLVPREGAA